MSNYLQCLKHISQTVNFYRIKRSFTIFLSQALLIDFPTIQELRGISRTVVDDFAMSQIQRADCLHILIAQPEVPDIKVFLHAFLMNRLRNNDNAPLHIPLERNLRRCLSILRANLCQNRMCKNAMLSFCHRSPRFRLYAKLLHGFQCPCLCKERVKLHLIDHRLDPCVQA